MAICLRWVVCTCACFGASSSSLTPALNAEICLLRHHGSVGHAVVSRPTVGGTAQLPTTVANQDIQLLTK